jgi:hypothetical protein
MGYFEELNGYELLKWLEIGKFADKEYEELPGGYEKLKSHSLDKESPTYQAYKQKLWFKAIKNIVDELEERQPYLLEGFYNRTAYFFNIHEKGPPDIRNLINKIENEYSAFRLKSDELALVKNAKEAFRDILYTTPMSNEMIQALIIKDDILDDMFTFFFNSKHTPNNFDEAAADYLEKEENDFLKNKLYDRVTVEYEAYVEKLKKLPPEKIIDKAYKLVVLENIQTNLFPQSSRLSTEHLKALMSYNHPLMSLYSSWQDRDVSLNDYVDDMIYDTASDAAKKIKSNESEIDYDYGDYEDEDEQDL